MVRQGISVESGVVPPRSKRRRDDTPGGFKGKGRKVWRLSR